MTGSRLLDLARRERPGAAPVAADRESCDLCGAVLASEHRHLLELPQREIRCACRPCSLLFDRPVAGGGRYKLIGDRRLALPGFVLDDLMWEDLRLPVDIAYFVRDTAAERVSAFYPSPMGATESLLTLASWQALEDANPVLATLAPDVEALLVNRARGERRQWIVPIDDCFALVGLMRTSWRGLTGGRAVWEALGRFFDDLDRRSRLTTSAAPAGAAQRGG